MKILNVAMKLGPNEVGIKLEMNSWGFFKKLERNHINCEG